MSNVVFVGADGGGTKTAVAAAGTDYFHKSNIMKAEGGSINYNFIGVERAAVNFSTVIHKIRLNCDAEIGGIAIGDPSFDELAPSPLTDKFIFLVRKYSGLPPQCPIYIKSDLFMTLYGTTHGTAGALMISGTGSMGMAVDAQDHIHVTGGWGRLTEDEGSGYYLAVNGIKAALHDFDETGPKTQLLEGMKQYFGIKNPRYFILQYYADRSAFPEIAGFAKVVGDLASSDTAAKQIVLQCSDILVNNTLSLLRKARLTSCTIGIYGSVLVCNSLIRNHFEEGILKIYPHAKIVVPDVRPEIAALNYVIEKEVPG